jgi:parallel beta-helix repeat protein
LTVESFEDGNLTFSALSGELCDGYTLQNVEFSPSCLVESCTVKRTRARGLLFQTDNVEVKNCYFEGMSSSAIKAAPDLGFWYEVGPTNGLYIHDNHFKNNGITANPAPTIALQPTHRADVEDVWGLHKNIRIENNVFEGERNSAIELCSADGIVIEGNSFDKNAPCPPIKLVRCRDAHCQE